MTAIPEGQTPASESKSPRRPGRPRQQGDADEGRVREQLLQAATELAIEQGFDACGLREIAARAEVSPGMISYYFGDRQGLYEAMFQRAIDRVGGQVQALLGDQTVGEGGDSLDEFVRIQVSAVAADPWLPKLIAREVLSRSDSPLRDTLGKQVGSGPLMLMIRWLEEQQASGAFRADFDPRLMAMTIASLSAFPFLMLPIIGDDIGLPLDDEFPERLIEHNQKILARALRARTETER